MRTVWTVIAAALLLLFTYIFLSVIVAYFGGDIWPFPVHDSWELPDSWAEWRDIAIVLSTFWWALAGLIMVVLLGVLVFLVLQIRTLLKDNVAPAVDSLKGTLDNVRGTTEFAGETVVSPIIRAYSVVRGVRSGVFAVRDLPNNVRRNRQKRGR